MEATVYDLPAAIPLDFWLWLLPFIGIGILVELLDRKLRKKRKHGKVNSRSGNKVTNKN